MDLFDSILQDLQITEENRISILAAHNMEDDPINQVVYLLKQLRRAKSMKNRRETLINAWYIGEVIETKAKDLTERTLCLKKLSPYYQKVVVRLYYIFEFLGVESVGNSRNTTLMMISKISNAQYVALQQEAITIARTRVIGGGIC